MELKMGYSGCLGGHLSVSLWEVFPKGESLKEASLKEESVKEESLKVVFPWEFQAPSATEEFPKTACPKAVFLKVLPLMSVSPARALPKSPSPKAPSPQTASQTKTLPGEASPAKSPGSFPEVQS